MEVNPIRRHKNNLRIKSKDMGQGERMKSSVHKDEAEDQNSI